MDAGNVNPDSERPGRWSSARGLLRRRWLLVVTIMALTVSGATIGLLSGSGLAASCGGFSGSSGGGQCSADLSVQQFISVSPAHVGQRIFYLIVITNKGPASANEVRLVDRLPLNVTGQWATSSEGQCEPIDKTKVADCFISYRLGSGQRAAVTLVVVAHSTVTLVNRAGVSSQTKDDNPGNNVATLRTRVQA